MKTGFWMLLFLLPGFLFAADSTAHTVVQKRSLKGYKKLFYQVILLHPKLNSALERDMLKHYLLGSGSTYVLSDSDFIRLRHTVSKNSHSKNCSEVNTNNGQYCVERIDLNEDVYFGWALGNINAIFQAGINELISLADFYDFNKAKKGVRTRKQEFLTRVFKFLAPKSSRPFVVTYQADGFIVTP